MFHAVPFAPPPGRYTLFGMRFLVTAGNTRESIDQVRDWGNIFTGNTGFAIARALSSAGNVDLLTSNRQHLSEVATITAAHRIDAAPFTTHADLRQQLAMRATQNRYDAIVMTAAIADYRPSGSYAIEVHHPDPDDPQREHWIVRNIHAGKIKSTHRRIAIVGEPTSKLIDLFRTAWGYTGLLVKFKLEVGVNEPDLLAIGQASRKASGADYLVANTLEMVQGDRPGAFLLDDHGHQWISRNELPEVLLRRLTGR